MALRNVVPFIFHSPLAVTIARLQGIDVARANVSELARLSREAADFGMAGRHDEAVQTWERLCCLAPENAIVATGLGSALLEAGRLEHGQAWIIKACGLFPTETRLFRLLAQLLMRRREYRAAIGALFSALALSPSAMELQADLARVLYLDGALAAALPYAIRAFDAAPTYDNASVLTAILLDLDFTDEPLEVVAQTLRGGAQRDQVLVLQSLTLQSLDRGVDAIEAAREALAAAPADEAVRFNLGAALLLNGEFTAEAWAHYESRTVFLKDWEWPEPERRWIGGDVAGRTILIHAEQGLGDTLQFVRYAPMVAALGAHVILAVQGGLVSLLKGTPGVDRVVVCGTDLPKIDLYCPLLSLPGLFGTRLDTIPPPIAYTHSFDPGPRRPGLHVGLVWAGNPEFIVDRRRSIDPAELAPLGDLEGVTFHSLQYGAETLPLPGMIDLIRGTTDFADTAARIASLDLVIAVDTSVAHLAATMGKPVWLMARHPGCWRWLHHGETTPWYPTMRLYRQQTSGDWRSVILRMRDDLSQMAASGEHSLAA